MSYETDLKELKAKETAAWAVYANSMANRENPDLVHSKLEQAFKLQAQRQILEKSKPEKRDWYTNQLIPLPKITLKRAAVEAIVAGIATLLLLAGLGTVGYIAVKNTPGWLVQNCNAILQGLGTVFGTFLGGILLRRVKTVRSVLHTVTCHTLFKDQE